MDENEYQRTVTTRLVEQAVEETTIKITESHNAIVVQAGNQDAAYTAEEARGLAEQVKQAGTQNGWMDRADKIGDYLLVLADVVDGLRDPEDVADQYGIQYTEDRDDGGE